MKEEQMREKKYIPVTLDLEKTSDLVWKSNNPPPPPVPPPANLSENIKKEKLI